jgi:hypothetical protein
MCHSTFRNSRIKWIALDIYYCAHEEKVKSSKHIVLELIVWPGKLGAINKNVIPWNFHQGELWFLAQKILSIKTKHKSQSSQLLPLHENGISNPMAQYLPILCTELSDNYQGFVVVVTYSIHHHHTPYPHHTSPWTSRRFENRRTWNHLPELWTKYGVDKLLAQFAIHSDSLIQGQFAHSHHQDAAVVIEK